MAEKYDEDQWKSFETPKRMDYGAFSHDDDLSGPVGLQTPVMSPPVESTCTVAMRGSLPGIKRSCVMSFASRGREKDRDVHPETSRVRRRRCRYRAHAHVRGESGRSPSIELSRGSGSWDVRHEAARNCVSSEDITVAKDLHGESGSREPN
ncbi:hypothetical protein FVE85_6003 [Porphyridium purpureum]|uniref:Uncharacterized protein n=1 Tax=Porphyridium purpureum TaxID=35688 RepID=A0A5J4Z5C5_PORPP|nr:hypothetical protein FVE85_6003 [Porphyridium purpureum]|eukprot:POR0810..scf295_1